MNVKARVALKNFRPAVVGAPRTGFTLLINIISRLLPFTGHVVDRRSHVIRAFADLAGNHISNTIVEAVRASGLGNDLVYNPNFRDVAGGPRWVPPEQPEVACFRKYLGIRGHGDFTLITRHPRALFESEDIPHTHSHPAFWVSDPAASGLTAFASQRNPVGTLYSSCFSINALTSEYLQHFVAPEHDNDGLREHLALYKLTDLRFFAGLVAPLKNYLEEFLEVRERYRYVMRWEDLITSPVRTIIEVGSAMGLNVDEKLAADTWNDMSWRNLTGWHKHNFRRGHGIVGGWRRYLTNEHLALMRDMGLDRLSRELGYGSIPDLETSDYTAYQRRVAGMLARGEIYRDYPDSLLFEFAFNKSNLDSSAFPYQRYEWKQHTRVERSSMDREDILNSIWSAAEVAVGHFNQAMSELLALPFELAAPPMEMFEAFVQRNSKIIDRPASDAVALLQRAWQGQVAVPRLLGSIGAHNMVQFGSVFYGLPQSLGPIDLMKTDPSALPGVIKTASYDALRAALSTAAVLH